MMSFAFHSTKILLGAWIWTLLSVAAFAEDANAPANATNRLTPSQAQPASPTTPISVPSSPPAQKTRTNTMSFDDELIESMSTNPFDSLAMTGGKSSSALGHLYRKKTNFKAETRQTVQEMGTSQ
jgi:hypothetical protein